MKRLKEYDNQPEDNPAGLKKGDIMMVSNLLDRDPDEELISIFDKYENDRYYSNLGSYWHYAKKYQPKLGLYLWNVYGNPRLSTSNISSLINNEHSLFIQYVAGYVSDWHWLKEVFAPNEKEDMPNEGEYWKV